MIIILFIIISLVLINWIVEDYKEYIEYEKRQRARKEGDL